MDLDQLTIYSVHHIVITNYNYVITSVSNIIVCVVVFIQNLSDSEIMGTVVDAIVDILGVKLGYFEVVTTH